MFRTMIPRALAAAAVAALALTLPIGIGFAFVVWVVFSQLLMLHLPPGPLEHLVFPGG